MKKCFEAFCMAIGMFSALPCPSRVWNEAARPWVTLFLPLVGLFMGLLWLGVGYVLRLLELPLLMWAAVMTVMPYLVSGLIHLDGYMDVTDAVRSWRDQEERRRILKDPHVGSFAVIGCVMLFVLSFGCFASFSAETLLLPLVLIPVVSRTCSALAVTVLRPIFVSQYAGDYQKRVKKGHGVFLGILLLLLLAGGFVYAWQLGAVLLAVAAAYWLALLRGYHSLGGMNGDIAGYSLTWGELAGIAVLAIL